jgi:hypothetical protein
MQFHKAVSQCHCLTCAILSPQTRDLHVDGKLTTVPLQEELLVCYFGSLVGSKSCHILPLVINHFERLVDVKKLLRHFQNSF